MPSLKVWYNPGTEDGRVSPRWDAEITRRGGETERIIGISEQRAVALLREVMG
jgi:hypothetical protein